MNMHTRLASAFLALALAPAAPAMEMERPVLRFDQDCNLLFRTKLRTNADEPQPASIKIAPPKVYKYLGQPYPDWVGTADLDQFAGTDGTHLHIRSSTPIKDEPGRLALMIRTKDDKHHFFNIRLPHCRYAELAPAADPTPAPATEPANPEPEAQEDGAASAASIEPPPPETNPDALSDGDGSTSAAPAPAVEIPAEAEKPADLPAAEIPAEAEKPADLPAAEIPAEVEKPADLPAAEIPAEVEKPADLPTAEVPAEAEKPADAGTAPAPEAKDGLFDLPPVSEMNLDWLANKVLALGMNIRPVWPHILIALGALAGLLVAAMLLIGIKRRRQRQALEDSLPEDDFDDQSDQEPEMEPGEDPNSQIESQLDLAAAYIEMGKHDMAQPLLDEVLDAGTPEECAKAQELKSRIPAN